MSYGHRPRGAAAAILIKSWCRQIANEWCVVFNYTKMTKLRIVVYNILILIVLVYVFHFPWACKHRQSEIYIFRLDSEAEFFSQNSSEFLAGFLSIQMRRHMRNVYVCWQYDFSRLGTNRTALYSNVHMHTRSFCKSRSTRYSALTFQNITFSMVNVIEIIYLR